MPKNINKILVNTFSNWGALFVGIILTFVMSPIIIKSLGDTNYGIWSMMTSISGYLTLLDLGIGSAVTRYVSKSVKTGDDKYVSQIFNSALALYIIIGFIIILSSPAIGWITSSLMKQQAVSSSTIIHLSILICIDVAIFLTGAAYRGYFQGVQRYDLVNAVTIGISITKAVVFYFLLKSGYGLIALGYIIVIGDIVALFGYSLMVRFTNMKLRYSFKSIQKEDVKTLITYSKFTFINMMANQVIYYSDSFVIGAIISVAAITYYSIGWSLVEYLKKFCVSFSKVFIPVFSEMDAVSDNDSMRKLMFAGGKASLFLSLPLCLALLLVGDQFVTLWMGKEYSDKAYLIMVILLLPQFFEIPQQINCSLLFGTGKHKFLSYANTISGIANLILSIALAFKYGLIGVAIGTSIPQLILNGLVIPWYVCKQTNTSLLEYYIRVYGKVLIPAGVFSMVLSYLSSVNIASNYLLLVLNSFLAFLVYFVCFYLMGLRKEEKHYINDIINKVLRKARLRAA